MAVGYFVGGRQGMYIAFGIAAVTNLATYWFSASMVLRMQGAKPLDEKQYGYIRQMVQDLAQHDKLPMPALYFVDTPIPNAFATGRSPSHAAVAVTRGITEILEPHELKAVLAHELGHVKNYDMLVSTIAATIGGAISMLAELLFWGGSLFSDDERSNPLGTFVMILLAPFAAMLIQMAVSRSREYLADEHGARTIGHGYDLASALEKLEEFKPHLKKYRPSPVEEATAHLMFINLFNAQGFAQLFSTHPSTSSRVERLRKM